MTTSMNADTARPSPGNIGKVMPFVIALFFLWGFSTVLLDSLVPKLKTLFALSYAEVMLTQFCFFLAYFVMSIPAATLLGRIGYMRGIVAGLLVMAVGDLMFAPAAMLGTYDGILAALFVMASGITLLQVAANPLVAVLGPAQTSSSRLTLAQAFNSFGTAIGPWIGARLILGTTSGAAPDPKTAAPAVLAAFRRAEIHLVEVPFLAIAAILLTLALIFWLLRHAPGVPGADRIQFHPAGIRRILRNPRLRLGTLVIFLYVGAEVTIGSLMTNYLMQPNRLALAATETPGLVRMFWTGTIAQAGQLVSLYWTGAMIGRFAGSFILSRFRPGLVLTGFALTAACFVSLSALSVGTISVVAIIAVGLVNSIMFPTIFALAIEGLGEDTPQGSGLLCMAIVGGAVIPWLSGVTADHAGLACAMAVPVVCYLLIACYGLGTRNPA